MSIDRNAVKRVKIADAGNDFKYWQTQSYEKRLEALESIRSEYIEWKYGIKPGFQRVYSITKQT